MVLGLHETVLENIFKVSLQTPGPSYSVGIIVSFKPT